MSSSLPPRPTLSPSAGGAGGSSLPPPGALKRWKVLGAAIDVLVRTARSRGGDSALHVLAERALAVWREHAVAAVTFGPMSLSVDGRTALSAAEQQGRWLLPTFMSGLRAVRLESGTTVDDMVRLAEEIAALESNPASIGRFRDWLWADGAEGFVVELQPSFMELIEGAAPDAAVAGIITAVRSGPLAPTDGDAREIASSDIDAAALRVEFDVPLDLFAVSAHDRAFEVKSSDLRALRIACDDAAAWASAELDAVFSVPALQGMIAPQRVARRLIVRLEKAADAPLLDLLGALFLAQDGYKKSVASALEASAEAIGSAIARGAAPLAAEPAAALRRLVASAPAALGRAVIRELAARSIAEEGVIPTLCDLVDDSGPQVLLDVMLPLRGDGDDVVRFVRALAERSHGLALVVGLVERADADAAAAILAHVFPRAELPRVKPRLVDLLARGPAPTASAMLELLSQPDVGDGPRWIAEVLRSTQGAGWSGKNLFAACSILLRRGLGQAELLPLARSSTMAPTLRLAAIDCLATDPDLLAATMRWRLGELFDPTEIRERFRVVRAAGRRR